VGNIFEHGTVTEPSFFAHKHRLSTDKTTDCILDFLDRIGLAVEERPIRPGTFLPGIAVLDGVLIVDRNRLLYPGDLLQEGGHLAILNPEERKLAALISAETAVTRWQQSHGPMPAVSLSTCPWTSCSIPTAGVGP
jgi:hypothetical protein